MIMVVFLRFAGDGMDVMVMTDALAVLLLLLLLSFG